MPELNKKANTRCEHQRHTGCAIYGKRPMSCAIWSCRWLTSDDTSELRRPDRSHYVIDLVPDFIDIQHNETGKVQTVPVVQVWLDPNYPNAYQDSALLAFLQRRAKEGYACLVRTNAVDAFSIFAPSFCDDGEWHEVRHGTAVKQHTTEEIITTLGRIGGQNENGGLGGH